MIGKARLIALGLSLLAGAGIVTGIWMHGHSHGQRAAEAVHAAAIDQARAEARQVEKQRQEGVNRALQDQYDEVSSINAGLAADLDRLRQRPDRRVSGDPGADCAGASGPELAREHAEFLVRYAAKAAEQDAALKSCYRYADSLLHHARKRDDSAK